MSNGKILHQFDALHDHSFYGHGFWNSQNVLATAEVNNLNYSSKVVLRNANQPSTILSIYKTSGTAIHSVNYYEQDQIILVAHNGDWFNPEGNKRANLEKIDTKTNQSEIYYFNLPPELGLQHFLREDNYVYCLFRIPPDKNHDPTWKNSPLVRIDLSTHEVFEFSMPDQKSRDQFAFDGLSICANEHIIATTSQRGNCVFFWSKKSCELLDVIELTYPSGITVQGDIFYISSAKGLLISYDSQTKKVTTLSRIFLAASHHQTLL